MEPATPDEFAGFQSAQPRLPRQAWLPEVSSEQHPRPVQTQPAVVELDHFQHRSRHLASSVERPRSLHSWEFYLAYDASTPSCTMPNEDDTGAAAAVGHRAWLQPWQPATYGSPQQGARLSDVEAMITVMATLGTTADEPSDYAGAMGDALPSATTLSNLEVDEGRSDDEGTTFPKFLVLPPDFEGFCSCKIHVLPPPPEQAQVPPALVIPFNLLNRWNQGREVRYASMTMILWRDGALSGCCVYIVQVPAEFYCKTSESLMNSELTCPNYDRTEPSVHSAPLYYYGRSRGLGCTGCHGNQPFLLGRTLMALLAPTSSTERSAAFSIRLYFLLACTLHRQISSTRKFSLGAKF